MSTRNAAEYLRRTLDSLAAQSFPDYEVIIVDAGSTDNTLALLEEFTDPRIVVRRTTAIPLSEALNIGIAMARGEFIARQDADDVSYRDRFAAQVKFLRRRPKIGYVGCDMQLVDAQSRTIKNYYFPTSCEEIRARLVAGSVPLVHGALLFRAAVLREVNGYDPFFLRAEDYDLHLRLIRSCAVANIPEILVGLTVRDDSMLVTGGDCAPLRYSLFARFLHAIREREIVVPELFPKQVMFRRFCEWFESTDLDRTFRAGVHRRLARAKLSAGKYRQAGLHVLSALRLEPAVTVKNLFGTSGRSRKWNSAIADSLSAVFARGGVEL
jgi:hypothetical protein